ncbi:TPA: hypothetical protein SLG25_000342 [Citrobacter freundii]|nr:hypothetical protein [Citrobacter freundii]
MMTEYNSKSTDATGGESENGAVYNSSISNSTLKNSRVEKYSDKIGTGDDAKSSVVWFVITFTLTLYACIISAMVIVDILNNKGFNILNNVKESWAIFTPVITLSLGYMFGKTEVSKQEKLPKENAKDA